MLPSASACTRKEVGPETSVHPASLPSEATGAKILSRGVEVAPSPGTPMVRVRGCGGRVMSTCLVSTLHQLRGEILQTWLPESRCWEMCLMWLLGLVGDRIYVDSCHTFTYTVSSLPSPHFSYKECTYNTVTFSLLLRTCGFSGTLTHTNDRIAVLTYISTYTYEMSAGLIL